MTMFTLTALPVRTIGAAVINAKAYGAVGDGITDATDAINAAIAALPADGGTVVIDPGVYLIDPAKKILPRSNMHLRMAPTTILKGKTNALKRAYLIYINNKIHVEISGGILQGDRDTHMFSTTDTAEWNHGIQILGSSFVTVRDLYVGDCAGDGVCIGGDSHDVVLWHVIGHTNRRNGLSITKCRRIWVMDCEFGYTYGTSPQCGIDVEPDLPAYTSDVWIERCWLHHNSMFGINVYKQAGSVTIKDCTVERNRGNGIDAMGATGVQVLGGNIRLNGATGIRIDDGTSGMRIDEVLFEGNYDRNPLKTPRTAFTLTGYNAKIERDILVRGTVTDLVVGTNYYR